MEAESHFPAGKVSFWSATRLLFVTRESGIISFLSVKPLARILAFQRMETEEEVILSMVTLQNFTATKTSHYSAHQLAGVLTEDGAQHCHNAKRLVQILENLGMEKELAPTLRMKITFSSCVTLDFGWLEVS